MSDEELIKCRAIVEKEVNNDKVVYQIILLGLDEQKLAKAEELLDAAEEYFAEIWNWQKQDNKIIIELNDDYVYDDDTLNAFLEEFKQFYKLLEGLVVCEFDFVLGTK